MTPSRFTLGVLRATLLLLMLAQMAAASPVQSAAFDEGYTITYGYAYLRTGDIRLSRGQNPPLTDVLIALPLLMRGDIAFPIDHPTWAAGDVYGFSDEFLWKANPDPHRWVMLARLPEMALALLLACVVYAFTRSHFGDRAALAALFLCAFDPNIIAHGHIAGTDLGATLFMFSAVWVLTEAVKRTSLRRVIIAGLLAGAALSSKYSAVWLAPITLVIGLTQPILTAKARSREHHSASSYLRGKESLSARLRWLAVFGLAAFVVIWATFGFSIGPIASGGPAVPAPDYWASLGRVGNRVELGTPAFMLGQISPTGFVWYYPFVFLLKTPLPTLLLLATGVVSAITRRDRQWIAVALPPALFLLAAMSSNLSLGYRLILPILPFALMIAGRGVDALWSGAKQTTADTHATDNEQKESALVRVHPRPILIGALMIWLVFDTLSIAPNHIAYFNALAGNRDRDYDVLVDSNLDWGQDLIALRGWMHAQGIDTINLSYFGTARPAAYGLHVNLLPGFNLNDFGPEVDGFSAYALKPGWYAISATSLRLGLLYSYWDLYAPFRDRQPDARIGRSILAYRVEYASTDTNRVVVLGPLAGDLDRPALGGQPDRQLIVKWAGSDAAVIDLQGRARYITRGGEPIAGFAPDVHDALIAHAARLGSDASGQLRVFEIDAGAALEAKLASLARSEVAAPDDMPIHLPVEFEGGLALLGYDLTAEAGRPIDLVTYWRVRPPLAPRLAVFVHVVDSDGRTLAQGDGLNVRLSSLETGDVILQHVAIDRPEAASALEIGLYDPSGSRMSLALPEGQATDRVRVPLP